MKGMVKIALLILTPIILISISTESEANPEKITNSKAIVVSKLPAGARLIKNGNYKIFTYNGIFYTKTVRGYKIIKAPVGMHLSYLPSGAKKIIDGRKVYYVKNDTYFKYNFQTNTYIIIETPS